MWRYGEIKVRPVVLRAYTRIPKLAQSLRALLSRVCITTLNGFTLQPNQAAGVHNTALDGYSVLDPMYPD